MRHIAAHMTAKINKIHFFAFIANIAIWHLSGFLFHKK